MASLSSFLDGTCTDTDSVLRQLLMSDEAPKMFNDEFEGGDTDPVKTLKAEPGFCVKTKHEKTGGKIFINICKSHELPPPKDITADELSAILQSEVPSDYKVPMSLGEVHYETDKSGNTCTAYDVTINRDFYDKALSSLLFKTFLVTLSLEGLDDKYGLEMDKNDWIILKNKQYLGVMPKTTIRNRTKCLVTELTTSVRTYDVKVPKFTLRRQPIEMRTKMMEAEVQLPGVDYKHILLDIGEDRIKLEAISDDGRVKYVLDIFVPLKVLPYETSARFLAKQKVLCVTLPYATSEE